MRALLLPNIMTGEVVAESDFTVHSDIAEAISNCEPSHFYWWLPRKAAGKFPPRARQTAFYEDGILEFMTPAFTGRLVELFNRREGLHPVDAVATSRPGLVPVLRFALSTDSSHPVPCFSVEPRVYGAGAVAHNRIEPEALAVSALGYALGHGIYWSEWEMQEGLRTISAWLSPGARELAEKRSLVIPLPVTGPSEAELGPVDKTGPLLFAGRLNTNKRWTAIAEAFAKVVMARKDGKAWIHGGTGAFRKMRPEESRWLRVSERLPERQDFLNLLRRSPVGAYASVDEGANVTVMECLVHGMVMALPRQPWVQKLLSPLAYPYTFNHAAELAPLLDYLLDNTERCRAELKPHRELIRRRNSVEQWQAGWRQVVDLAEQENAVKPLRAHRQAVLKELEVSEQVTFQALAAVRSAWVTKGGSVSRRADETAYAIYRSVRDLDDYESAVPCFVKEGARCRNRSL